MKRGTIFIVLFIVIAAGIIGLSRFLGAQPPLEITIAVEPTIRSWLENASNSFVDSEPVVNTRRVTVRLTPVEDLDVWLTTGAWTATDHPDAWVPASSISLRYAAESGLPLQTLAESLARTPLVWGGFRSRVDVLTEGGRVPLDWEQVAAAAKAESWAAVGGQAGWQFIKLAFSQPTDKMPGLAVLLAGAADFNQTPTLSGDQLRSRQFRDWMLPVLQSGPKRDRSIASDPAAAMAQRGTAVGEIGLLPEANWLQTHFLMRRSEDVLFFYPEYQIVLDFPMARWDDAQTSADTRAALDALKNWLLAPEQQALALEYGLRPFQGEPSQEDTLFMDAVPFGIKLIPDYGKIVQAPPRADVQGLVSWVEAN